MRNYVFYGSANTELAYNIKHLIETYPYKFWVATLTESLNTIDSLLTINNDVEKAQTSLVFSEQAIKDGIEEFNFNDNVIDFDWTKYDVVDKNGTRYPILNVISPYLTPDALTVQSVSDVLIDTQPSDTDTTLNPAYIVPSFNTMKVVTNTPHNNVIGEVITLKNISVTDGLDTIVLDDEYVVSLVISSTEFLVVNKYKANIIVAGGKPKPQDAITFPTSYAMIANDEAIVRKYPAEYNSRPNYVRILIKGNLFENFLESVVDGDNEISGFIISPNKTILSEFEFNLTQIQRMLLAPAPINPTPWPRRKITNNLQHITDPSIWNPVELEFIEWIQNPDVLFVKELVDTDNDVAFSDIYSEYRLVRALSLDETTTNQLIRRCIPQDFLSELNDTPDADFQRFILIAGWFFDQIRMYVKFLKYVHHINTSDFNQLSPEYYRMYASHYGLDLFTDDGIDFSKLVIKTEPGLYFRDKALEEKDSKFYRFTLQQLQYERQKRLLISLFYLYKSKGTQGTIQKLVSLLGSPEGFFELNEYVFKLDNTDEFDYFNLGNMKGSRVIDNDKINIPSYEFEIDPNFPITDLSMPPVYRQRLKNESTYNLRQISVLTNPNGAIDNEIINVFGKTKHKYLKFNTGEFANLQKLNSDLTSNGSYHFLPLTIPDKFSGLSIEYMIPREGFVKGVGNNLEEVNIHLCSLFSMPDNTNFLNDTVIAYPLPEQISNYNLESFKSNQLDTTIEDDLQPNIKKDFSILYRYLNVNNDINNELSFIICRLEGKDLVLRTKLKPETDITEIRATSEIRILSLGNIGDNITFHVVDPSLGSIVLGSYTIDNTDTTIELLTEHIANSLSSNIYGYEVNFSDVRIRITAPESFGEVINDTLITTTATLTAGVGAYTIIDLSLVNLTNPVQISVTGGIMDSLLTTFFNTGFSSTLTNSEKIQSLIDVINNNNDSFTATLETSTSIRITASNSLGASMNGSILTLLSGTKNSIPVNYTFSNGVNGFKKISTLINPFTGGVSLTNDSGERVAIMKNVFSADGLNHTLRMLFRPEGVEVYKDYSHLGINNLEKIGVCLWRNPSTSSITQPFASLEIPKYLISECEVYPYRSELFETLESGSNKEKDIPKPWDLFIGLPTNLDFYFKKVTVFENYGIDSFNESNNIRSNDNYTAEYWSFSLENNEGDVNDLKISCEFSQIEPNIALADYSYQYPVEQFNNKIVVKDLKLTTKSLLKNSTKKYFYTIQDFFNVNKIFEQNAYMNNIHQSYDYENFNSKVIKLYTLYSPQVLSYESLIPFLDLIENKFKPIIKNFIPIVVNISEFGRLIQNSLFTQPKMRYSNIHKKCIGKIIGNASVQIRVYEKIYPYTSFTIELENGDGSSLIPPIQINWLGSEELTEFSILSELRNPAVNPNPQKIKILMNDGVLAIVLNSEWYYSNYNQNPNDVKLIFNYTSVDVDQIPTFNFEHGTLDFNDNNCGSIEHLIPVRNTKDKFIYFESEDQPNTYIYFDSENNPNKTYIN